MRNPCSLFLPFLQTRRKNLTTSTPDWKKRFETFLNGRGKIQQLAELTAVESMQATAEEQRKNQEAESSKVRKQLWDWDESVKDDDEMRQTILGDTNTTYPAPIIMQSPPQQEKQSLLPAVAMAAVAGLGGYLLANHDDSPTPTPPPVAPVNYTDETISVGLGRIEDYLKSDPR